MPDGRVHRSFLAAMDEFAAEGRGGPEDTTMLGGEMRTWRTRWHDAEGFAEFVRALHRDSDPEAPRPAHWVPSTTWWWVEDDDFLGRIVLRHHLTARLRLNGGHVGYDVRPSARRKGHASAMLAAVLPLARARGLDPVLVTCAPDNVASRRVIESNGGSPAFGNDATLGFWVPTS